MLYRELTEAFIKKLGGAKEIFYHIMRKSTTND